MLKLLVVEDHALVREGLVQTLHTLDEGINVFQAATCDRAIKLLSEGHDFDLVLLDLGLPETDGLTCLALFREQYPTIPVVIVSAYDDAHTVNRAMKNGASGFVPKSYSSDRLIDALRTVLDGGVFTPDRVLPTRLGADLPPAPTLSAKEAALAEEFGLTERKAEILALLVRGKSTRDIAAQLGLMPGTVKIHLTSIFKSLGVTSRTQALVAVAKYGIKL